MDTALNHRGRGMLTSEQIFSEVYSQCYGAIYNAIMTLVHEKMIAEDIAQDVFLKFWLSMDKLQINDHKAYLFIMARNEAVTYLRRTKQIRSTHALLMKKQVEGINFTEEFIYQRETEVLLQKAVHRLSPQRKKVYVLCKMEGHSYEQAASMLGISISTVREVMRVANQEIRKFVSLHLDDAQCKPKVKRHQLPRVNELKAA